MELLQTMEQGLSRTEERPCTLTYLVNLLLCQILKVGVVDHDGGRRHGRLFTRTDGAVTAMSQNINSGVVQLMRMSNNARE
jgi:hypothetical protein